QVSPQSLLQRRPPREEVVRGEDRRRARPQKAIVELGHEPLDVQDVRAAAHEGCDAERMLCDLERYAQPRADEEPRGERIERLAAHVAVRSGRFAEPEAGGDELDLDAGV